MQSEPEIRLWVAEGTANGMRPWVTKFSGVLYDRRWLPMVERIYDWHYRHERYLRNETPLARVALLLLGADGDVPCRRRRRAIAHGDHVLGMYHALVEARVPFELVHEAFLTPDRLDAFKLLILADAAALSDAQCARHPRLRQARRQRARHVRHLAVRRDRQPARTTSASPISSACRSPAASTGRCRTPICASSRIARPAAATRSSTGLDDAPRIINGVFRIDVRPPASFPSPLTLIPSYPDLPMEDVYPRVAQTDTRELYLRDLGRSRVVYFPWDIDRTFWDVLARRSPDAAAERRRVGRATSRRRSRSTVPACSTSRRGASATR